MRINISKTLDFSIDEVAAAMSPEEMLTLFTRAANRLAETGSPEERRVLARVYAHAMSENAKRMLAEVFAVDYGTLITTRDRHPRVA